MDGMMVRFNYPPRWKLSPVIRMTQSNRFLRTERNAEVVSYGVYTHSPVLLLRPWHALLPLLLRRAAVVPPPAASGEAVPVPEVPRTGAVAVPLQGERAGPAAVGRQGNLPALDLLDVDLEVLEVADDLAHRPAGDGPRHLLPVRAAEVEPGERPLELLVLRRRPQTRRRREPVAPCGYVVHRRQHVHVRLPHHLCSAPGRCSTSFFPPVGITGLKERLDFFLPFWASQSEHDKDSESTVTIIIKRFLCLLL
jgi:hypothetical protein|uniref:Uncharacterized protein n=1 Tax=Zea mays TaxID=4577 RepID=C0PM51_MAIZE|nr:unknown [Zea mays]